MKKYLLILFLLFSSLFAYPRCSTDLASALHAVYHFPEGRELLAQTEAEGPIQIYRAPFNSNSHAMWIGINRAIVINANSFRSFGEIVRSILFELHNAKTNSEFAYLDRLAHNRRISKSDYVKAVERLEHKNAYNTSRLIDRAISFGYFPSDAFWPIPSDFQAHYQVQKQAGHSRKIADTYDSLSHCTICTR